MIVDLKDVNSINSLQEGILIYGQEPRSFSQDDVLQAAQIIVAAKFPKMEADSKAAIVAQAKNLALIAEHGINSVVNLEVTVWGAVTIVE
jgi:hypothetical protein